MDKLKIIALLFLSSNIFCHAQNIKVMTYNIRLDVAVDGENDWSHRKDFLLLKYNFMNQMFSGFKKQSLTK